MGSSTLLTVGYGDIYPITPIGQMFSIVITFLGVGMVAIPTGIISAGFVDQYSRLKYMSEYANEEDIHFIKVHLGKNDSWTGKQIKDLGIPGGVIVAAIQRDGKALVPRGDTKMMADDVLILGAESFDDNNRIDLKEVVLLKHNPWNGQKIRDLDISRQTLIIMINRNGKAMIPSGDFVLLEGDKVIMYTQMHFNNAHLIQV